MASAILALPPFIEGGVVVHELIVVSSVIFLLVLGHAARTGLRFPLEQVLANLAEHVFFGVGRRKLMKHLPNPRPLSTFARSLWDNGDCDRCAVARAEPGSSETTTLRRNTPVSSRCGCSTTATYGGTDSGGRNHCVRRNHPTSTAAGAINSLNFAYDCLPSVARVLILHVLLCFCVFSARVCLSAPTKKNRVCFQAKKTFRNPPPVESPKKM